jgi:hypothetical protein
LFYSLFSALLPSFVLSSLWLGGTYFSGISFSVRKEHLTHTLSLFARFDSKSIKFVPSSSNLNLPTLHYGVWLQRDTEAVAVTDGSGTSIYVYDKCRSIPSAVEIDSRWKASRAFATMAPCLGILLLIPVWCASCCGEKVRSMWKSLGCIILVIMPLFQGLGFLLFKSSACEEAPVVDVLKDAGLTALGELASEVYGECDWDGGSAANVIAVVFWFLTGVAVMFFPPPPPDQI